MRYADEPAELDLIGVSLTIIRAYLHIIRASTVFFGLIQSAGLMAMPLPSPSTYRRQAAMFLANMATSA